MGEENSRNGDGVLDGNTGQGKTKSTTTIFFRRHDPEILKKSDDKIRQCPG